MTLTCASLLASSLTLPDVKITNGDHMTTGPWNCCNHLKVIKGLNHRHVMMGMLWQLQLWELVGSFVFQCCRNFERLMNKRLVRNNYLHLLEGVNWTLEMACVARWWDGWFFPISAKEGYILQQSLDFPLARTTRIKWLMFPHCNLTELFSEPGRRLTLGDKSAQRKAYSCRSLC